MKIQVGFTAVSHHWTKWTKSLSSQIYLWIPVLQSFSLLFPPQGGSSFQTWYFWNIFQGKVNFWTLFSEESFNLLLPVGFVHLITANSGIFTHTRCFVSLKQLVLATAGGEINVPQTQLWCFWAQRGGELVVPYESIVSKKSVVPGLAASQLLQDTGPTVVTGCTCAE